MNLADYNLKGARRSFSVANTPLFLIRKLKEDSIAEEISNKYGIDEILDVLRATTSVIPKTLDEFVSPYLLLVCLWKKTDVRGLTEAAEISAPYLSWYKCVCETLLATFSQIQVQTIQGPLDQPSALVLPSSSSSSPTTIIIP
jgi:hypothetical protein